MFQRQTDPTTRRERCSPSTAPRARVVVVAATWLLAVCASDARANPLDVVGLGSRGGAMVGALSASADDYTAVHYNMAALTRSRGSFGVGLVASLDDVSIHLKGRPDGYDLPDQGASSAAIPSKYRLSQRSDTNDIPNIAGVHIGAVGQIGIKDLHFGIGAYLPFQGLGSQRTRFPDEREQYFSNRLDFELIGQRSQHFVFIVGTAYALTDWLSVGAGISFLPRATAQTGVYLDNAADQSDVDLVVVNEQKGRVAPHLGLLLTPSKETRFSLAWRGANYFAINLDNNIQIKGFETSEDFPVLQRQRVVTNFTPEQAVFGAALERSGWLVNLDASWQRWSDYIDTQGFSNTGFDDTLGVRLGVERQASADTAFRFGVGFEPSPVPEQTGRTNYVDNDRVIAGLGAGHQMKVFGSPLELGWFLQLHYLRPRDTNKDAAEGGYPVCADGVTGLCDEIADDTPDAVTGQPVPAYQGLQTGNPGFPGFQSWGIVMAFGVDARWKF